MPEIDERPANKVHLIELEHIIWQFENLCE